MTTNICGEHEIAMEAAIRKATEEFEADMNSLALEAEEDAKDLEDDVPEGAEIALGFDLEIGTEQQIIKLHLPSVKLVDQKIGSMHLPEVSIKQRDIVFHTPTTVMVDKVTGKYPETTCKMKTKKIAPGVKTKVPVCKTEWKDIITTVPEIRMQEQRIRMGIPEMTMVQKDIITGIPEITLVLREIKFNTPTITIRNVRVEIEESKRKATELQSEYEVRTVEIQEEYRNDIKVMVEPPHTALFNCHRQQINSNRQAAFASIDTGFNTINTTIKQLQDQGVPADHESIKQLEQSRVQMVEEREKTEASFDSAIANLNNSQQESLESIRNGL